MSPSVSVQAVRRRRAAAALIIAAGVAASLAAPTVASAATGGVTSADQISQIYDGTVIADGAAVILPIQYVCDGLPAPITIDLRQSQSAHGSVTQRVDCTGRFERTEIRIEAQDGGRFTIGGAVAVVTAFARFDIHPIALR